MGYKCVHILPVGTSLLRNYANTSEGKAFVDGHGISGWDRLSPEDPIQRRLCEELRGEAFERLFSYARSNREKASAELSSLLKACAKFGCGASETLVILFATNTCNSILAMDVLGEVLKSSGYNIEKKVMTIVPSVEEFDAAMAEIVEKVIMEGCRYRSQGSRLYVNATPGYKAESAYLTAAALVLGVDAIYYMHDAFNDIVILPVIPLNIDKKYLEMLKSLSEETEASDAERIVGGGYILRELEISGLVKRTGKGYRTREWVKALLEPGGCGRR